MGLTTQAQASQNSGWIYTSNQSGAVYFDADLNGDPGVEKITVCDNTSDGRGITAEVRGEDGTGPVVWIVSDPSNNGNCEHIQGNFFLEETPVQLVVYEYWGSHSDHLSAVP
ncbi:hypothetical protein QA802_40895 [Streptomyces sp. B21-105]|uniref:hypothetical protein n=1 Tax=Streptomyces sp. B21-105 TaxID=3039417 RepID=UPI002FF036A1